MILDAGGDRPELKAKDEGEGFIPRFKMDSASSAGLGLSGAYRRLQLFGGQLYVESNPNKGTAVTVVTPLESLKLLRQ